LAGAGGCPCHEGRGPASVVGVAVKQRSNRDQWSNSGQTVVKYCVATWGGGGSGAKIRVAEKPPSRLGCGPASVHTPTHDCGNAVATSTVATPRTSVQGATCCSRTLVHSHRGLRPRWRPRIGARPLGNTEEKESSIDPFQVAASSATFQSLPRWLRPRIGARPDA
jgi:hypothetical protein